jgi:tRNA U34 5-methylaminomethyl-2-thiouridine-forming methyltransferase MnmC
MRSLACALLIVTLTGFLGGCRQADGPVPTPSQTYQEELVDVARDLQNVASGRDPNGPNDLANDLRKYTEKPAAKPLVDELSARTAKALQGRDLADQDAQRLAHNLWVSVYAKELSERQVEALQNDMQALLTSLGASEESARQVAVQVGEVQSWIGRRPRRWYELF